jgi:hypothetical protein
VLTSDAAQRIGRLLVEDEDRDGGLAAAMPIPRLPARVAALGIFLGIALATLHAAHTTGSFGARVRVSPANPIGRPEEISMPQSVTRAAMASAVALSVATSSHAQDAVQWRLEDGGNGHWYAAVISHGITWTASRSASQNQGGDLVSLNSSTEMDWVFGAIVSEQALWNGRIGPWIGLYQLPDSVEPDGGWTWVDGAPLEEARWIPGEPLDARNGGPPCAFAHYQRFGSLFEDTWVADPDFHYPAYHLETYHSFIIEWSADCNADGIVDYGQIRAGDLADTNGNNIPDCCESLSDACAGDLVRDGRVDGVDLAAVLNN